MKKITDAEFQSAVLESSQPVLVDIYADWCMPCKALSPILERISEVYAGKASVVKVDGETESQTVSEYGVRALPTLLLFKGGEIKKRFTGLQSEKSLRDALDSLI